MRSAALLFLVFFLVPAFASAQRPDLVFEKMEYNFGTISQGEKVDVTFRFQNAGSAPLMIDRVRTSCGCTAALLSSDILAPGEVGEVEAEFDSTRFKGRVSKTIYLYTNDPETQVAQLTIEGNIEETLAAEPSRLDFQNLQAGETKTLQVELFNRSDRSVTLGAVQVTNPQLQADLAASVLGPGESTSLAVVAEPKAAGRLSGYVIIPTDHPDVTQIRLPVYGRVNE